MRNYLQVVGIVTGVLIVFVTLIQFEVAKPLIWLIFIFSPILMIWMTVSILLAPIEIKETFEEQWYQDRPDLLK
ncbi:hypothetical protein [Algoriphagus zhangzhouensis]|uniref:Uncharacterized protein n=1 Tax=Algoriphagus zhangzhouensis TaxID=1073327 RepID=A0A1M7ZBE9_9BACT|nr:hypothetical protein [Algoriphagus zhangzhouensis]TDY46879.1 hypothetical protein A8938_1328 [Algoriphagus zhangzhouensis]SHO62162.1 hypothetical protein SAMN04488108_1934 [Algoriphagus zhangzhouensis]